MKKIAHRLKAIPHSVNLDQLFPLIRQKSGF